MRVGGQQIGRYQNCKNSIFFGTSFPPESRKTDDDVFNALLQSHKIDLSLDSINEMFNENLELIQPDAPNEPNITATTNLGKRKPRNKAKPTKRQRSTTKELAVVGRMVTRSSVEAELSRNKDADPHSLYEPSVLTSVDVNSRDLNTVTSSVSNVLKENKILKKEISKLRTDYNNLYQSQNTMDTSLEYMHTEIYRLQKQFKIKRGNDQDITARDLLATLPPDDVGVSSNKEAIRPGASTTLHEVQSDLVAAANKLRHTWG